MSGSTAQVLEFRIYAHKRSSQTPPHPTVPVSGISAPDRVNHLMHHTLLTIIDYASGKINMPRHKIVHMLFDRYRFQSPMELTVGQMDDAIRFLIDLVDDSAQAH